MKNRRPPLEVSMSYDTALSLHVLLTRQWTRIVKDGNETLRADFDQINRFYNYLTEYVEKNS